jgi:hypothetical protein
MSQPKAAVNDVDFPSLSSLSSSTPFVPHPPPSSSSPPRPISPPPAIPRSPLKSPGIRSPENIFQTEITAQEFSQALASALPLIPDPAYELPVEDPKLPYPQSVTQHLLQPEFFAKYDLSILFYNFYYRAGTPAQLFAANELKRRGWLFHLKLETWLRRLGEPMETNDAYEVANYDYFETGGTEGWSVQTKSAFMFEFANIGERHIFKSL